MEVCGHLHSASALPQERSCSSCPLNGRPSGLQNLCAWKKRKSYCCCRESKQNFFITQRLCHLFLDAFVWYVNGSACLLHFYFPVALVLQQPQDFPSWGPSSCFTRATCLVLTTNGTSDGQWNVVPLFFSVTCSFLHTSLVWWLPSDIANSVTLEWRTFCCVETFGLICLTSSN